MRDGRDLKGRARGRRCELRSGLVGAEAAIDPPRAGGGHRRVVLLTGVWRYFRHTLTNYYATTPGRTLALLRGWAAPFHPVIGIGAQQRHRADQRARWLDQLAAGKVPGQACRRAHGLHGRVGHRTPRTRPQRVVSGRPPRRRPVLAIPVGCAVGGRDRAADQGGKSRRRDHHWFVRQSDFKRTSGQADDTTRRQRAESGSSAVKRCLALADLLRDRAVLRPSWGRGRSPKGSAAASALPCPPPLPCPQPCLTNCERHQHSAALHWSTSARGKAQCLSARRSANREICRASAVSVIQSGFPGSNRSRSPA